MKQKCKHSSSHIHAGRIILPEGASGEHHRFTQDRVDAVALLGFGLSLSHPLPLPRATRSVLLACYNQSLKKLPESSLFTPWALNQGLDPARDRLVASPELLFFCFALAQASYRLSGFPSASPSAFISWLPERAKSLCLCSFVSSFALLICTRFPFVCWSIFYPPLKACLLSWCHHPWSLATSPPPFPRGAVNGKPDARAGQRWTDCHLLLWFLQARGAALSMAGACCLCGAWGQGWRCPTCRPQAQLAIAMP